MKLLVIVAVLPLVMSSSLPLDSLKSFFTSDKVKGDVTVLLQRLATSELTRNACETECKQLAKELGKDDNGCFFACFGLQEGLKKAVTPSKKRMFISVDNFNIANIFDLDSLLADLQIMLDVLGTDPMEKACEGECHHLLSTGHVLNFGCPLVCHGKLGQIKQSTGWVVTWVLLGYTVRKMADFFPLRCFKKKFQELCHIFHLTPDPKTSPVPTPL